MRLIDADVLKDALNADVSNTMQTWDTDLLQLLMIEIDEAPTIEAEPVVYCRECKHWGMRKHATLKKNEVYYCKMVDGITYGRSYCWYGEKRRSKDGVENA